MSTLSTWATAPARATSPRTTSGTRSAGASALGTTTSSSWTLRARPSPDHVRGHWGPGRSG
eukprot:15064082-Alexandrium_andersonii.AAC.1